MGFSRQEHWSGLPFASPGIFPTQGSNPGLPRWRQTLYPLRRQGKQPNRNKGALSRNSGAAAPSISNELGATYTAKYQNAQVRNEPSTQKKIGATINSHADRTPVTHPEFKAARDKIAVIIRPQFCVMFDFIKTCRKNRETTRCQYISQHI